MESQFIKVIRADVSPEYYHEFLMRYEQPAGIPDPAFEDQLWPIIEPIFAPLPRFFTYDECGEATATLIEHLAFCILTSDTQNKADIRCAVLSYSWYMKNSEHDIYFNRMVELVCELGPEEILESLQYLLAQQAETYQYEPNEFVVALTFMFAKLIRAIATGESVQASPTSHVHERIDADWKLRFEDIFSSNDNKLLTKGILLALTDSTRAEEFWPQLLLNTNV